MTRVDWGWTVTVTVIVWPFAACALYAIRHAINHPEETMTAVDHLVLEIRNQPNATPVIGPLMLTPPINEDYWAYRVRVAHGQAIVGFPKFATVGIGFAIEEEDWNANLPYTSDAEEIYEHIEHNRGDDAISREVCVAAIRLIQEAARHDRAEAQR